MFGIGGTEIIVILIVALLFLGPDKLPEAAKTISKGIRDLKRQSRTLTKTIEEDERIGGALRDIKSALRGEDEPPPRPKPFKPKPQLTAPTESLADKPGEADFDADHHDANGVAHGGAKSDAKAEANGEAIVEAKPQVRLPPTAGEPDPDHPVGHDDDDDLASMIRPASGTVAKGTEGKSGSETKHG
jgi:sec-independent protein translocase protein TatB